VIEKMGVPPERVVDLLALVGDAVDNIPGVPGIGEKGARDLIQQFGSLDELLTRAAEVKRAAYREGLLQHADKAHLSRQLATLDDQTPVSFDPEASLVAKPDRQSAYELFKELEFSLFARDMAPEVTTFTFAHRATQRGRGRVLPLHQRRSSDGRPDPGHCPGLRGRRGVPGRFGRPAR
jgi:DNA polymerase I